MIDPTVHASGYEHVSGVMYLLCYLLCYIHGLLIGVACLHTVIHEPCPTFTCETPTMSTANSRTENGVDPHQLYCMSRNLWQNKVLIRTMEKRSSSHNIRQLDSNQVGKYQSLPPVHR